MSITYRSNFILLFTDTWSTIQLTSAEKVINSEIRTVFIFHKKKESATFSIFFTTFAITMFIIVRMYSCFRCSWKIWILFESYLPAMASRVNGIIGATPFFFCIWECIWYTIYTKEQLQSLSFNPTRIENQFDFEQIQNQCLWIARACEKVLIIIWSP